MVKLEIFPTKHTKNTKISLSFSHGFTRIKISTMKITRKRKLFSLLSVLCEFLVHFVVRFFLFYILQFDFSWMLCGYVFNLWKFIAKYHFFFMSFMSFMVKINKNSLRVFGILYVFIIVIGLIWIFNNIILLFCSSIRIKMESIVLGIVSSIFFIYKSKFKDGKWKILICYLIKFLLIVLFVAMVSSYA